MDKKRQGFVFATALLIMEITGCSSQSAPGLKGHWQPVNRFAETVEAIPIHPLQVFYPTPVDATLKALLERWAKDSSMTLSYRHPNDFTLYGPVADIRTSDLQAALAALNTAYAGQEISIAIEQRTIVVERRSSPGVGEVIRSESDAAVVGK